MGERKLTNIKTLKAEMSVYPGLHDPKYQDISGEVTLKFKNDNLKFVLSMDVDGLEESLEYDGGADSVGGIHVHEGESCDAAGGHYFLGTDVEADPWFSYQNSPIASAKMGTGY